MTKGSAKAGPFFVRDERGEVCNTSARKSSQLLQCSITERTSNEERQDDPPAQARIAAELVGRYLLHLPYEAAELRMLPRAVFDAAAPLFAIAPDADDPFARGAGV